MTVPVLPSPTTAAISPGNLAEEAAGILAANGVHVWIYPELMPTPALSYAVRELGCQSGIMITASHNPPEYNGYKVYDHTGGQIVSEFARRVSEAIASVDPFDGVRRSSLEEGLQSGSIEYLTQEFIDGYIEAVLRLQLEPGHLPEERAEDRLFAPQRRRSQERHCGALPAGLEEIYVVADQSRPNGDFPTCPSPNPENPDTMKMTLDLGRYIQADIAFATDPDSDRIGVAAPEADGSWRLFTGNELGVLLLDYICRQRTAQGTMPRESGGSDEHCVHPHGSPCGRALGRGDAPGAHRVQVHRRCDESARVRWGAGTLPHGL